MEYLNLFCLGLCLVIAAAKPATQNDNYEAKLRRLAAEPEFRKIMEKLIAFKRHNIGPSANNVDTQRRQQQQQQEQQQQQQQHVESNVDDIEPDDSEEDHQEPHSGLDDDSDEDAGDMDSEDEISMEDIVFEFLIDCEQDERMIKIEEYLRSNGDYAKRGIGAGEDYINYLKDFPSITSICRTIFVMIQKEKEPWKIAHEINSLLPWRRLDRVTHGVVYNFIVLCDQNERLMKLEIDRGCTPQRQLRRQLRNLPQKRYIPALQDYCEYMRKAVTSHKTVDQIAKEIMKLATIRDLESSVYTNEVIAIQWDQGLNLGLGCQMYDDLCKCTGLNKPESPTAVCKKVNESYNAGDVSDMAEKAVQIQVKVGQWMGQYGLPHETNNLTILEDLSIWMFQQNCHYESLLENEEKASASYSNELKASGFLPVFLLNKDVCNIVNDGIRNQDSAEEILMKIQKTFEEKKRLVRVQNAVVYDFVNLCNQNKRLLEYEAKTGCLCGQYEFTCVSDKTCIPLEWRCDAYVDCPDWTDQEECSAGCSTCLTTDDFCIPWYEYCNGEVNCADGSDEADDVCLDAKKRTQSQGLQGTGKRKLFKGIQGTQMKRQDLQGIQKRRRLHDLKGTQKKRQLQSLQVKQRMRQRQGLQGTQKRRQLYDRQGTYKRTQIRQEKRHNQGLTDYCEWMKADVTSYVTSNTTVEELIDKIKSWSLLPAASSSYTDHIKTIQYDQGINFFLGCELLGYLLNCTGKKEEPLELGTSVPLPSPRMVCDEVYAGIEAALTAEEIEENVAELFPEYDHQQKEKSQLEKLEDVAFWIFRTNCGYEYQLEDAEIEAGMPNGSAFFALFPSNRHICDIYVNGVKSGWSFEKIEEAIEAEFKKARESAELNYQDNSDYGDDNYDYYNYYYYNDGYYYDGKRGLGETKTAKDRVPADHNRENLKRELTRLLSKLDG